MIESCCYRAGLCFLCLLVSCENCCSACDRSARNWFPRVPCSCITGKLAIFFKCLAGAATLATQSIESCPPCWVPRRNWNVTVWTKKRKVFFENSLLQCVLLLTQNCANVFIFNWKLSGIIAILPFQRDQSAYKAC